MKKRTKKSRTGRTWSVMILDDYDVFGEPKLNEKAVTYQHQSDMLDAMVYGYVYADVMFTDQLYHQVRLKELKHKLIKDAAMLAVSVTTLVMDLSIFFGWWI